MLRDFSSLLPTVHPHTRSPETTLDGRDGQLQKDSRSDGGQERTHIFQDGLENSIPRLENRTRWRLSTWTLKRDICSSSIVRGDRLLLKNTVPGKLFLRKNNQVFNFQENGKTPKIYCFRNTRSLCPGGGISPGSGPAEVAPRFSLTLVVWVCLRERSLGLKRHFHALVVWVFKCFLASHTIERPQGDSLFLIQGV